MIPCFWSPKNFSVGRFDLGGSQNSIRMKVFKSELNLTGVELVKIFPTTFVSHKIAFGCKRYWVLKSWQKGKNVVKNAQKGDTWHTHRVQCAMWQYHRVPHGNFG